MGEGGRWKEGGLFVVCEFPLLFVGMGEFNQNADDRRER